MGLLCARHKTVVLWQHCRDASSTADGHPAYELLKQYAVLHPHSFTLLDLLLQLTDVAHHIHLLTREFLSPAYLLHATLQAAHYLFCPVSAAEDMWHVYNLVREGDEVTATTFRKIAKDSGTSVESERVKIKLTIKVEGIEFDPEGGQIGGGLTQSSCSSGVWLGCCERQAVLRWCRLLRVHSG